MRGSLFHPFDLEHHCLRGVFEACPALQTQHGRMTTKHRKEHEMNKKLYIGNLASGVTEQELRDNFSTVETLFRWLSSRTSSRGSARVSVLSRWRRRRPPRRPSSSLTAASFTERSLLSMRPNPQGPRGAQEATADPAPVDSGEVRKEGEEAADTDRQRGKGRVIFAFSRRSGKNLDIRGVYLPELFKENKH